MRGTGPFFNVHPLYNRLRHLRGSVLLIEGIIGAGKTTLGMKLYNLLTRVDIPVMIFEEEVDAKMLDLFLSDMKKYAFSFQIHMLVQRQKIYMKALQFVEKNNGVAIVDRSLLGDWSFCMLHNDYGNISDLEYQAYESVMSSTRLPVPASIFYLEVTPETAHKRIVARNRGREPDVYTLEYLSDLDMNYKVAMEQSDIDIHYIDWNQPSNLSDDQLIDLCDLANIYS